MADLLMFKRTTLTGGGATAVDGISATALVGGELCWATVSNVKYTYQMNATSGAAADGVNIIIPVVGTVGTKRWILQGTSMTTGVATTAITDNTSTTQIATTSFAKSQDAVLSNPKAMSQAVNMTYAASGSSGITVADNDNIDFGTGNFTLGWKGSLPSWTPGTTRTLLYKYSVAGFYRLFVTSANYLQVNLTADDTATTLRYMVSTAPTSSIVAKTVHEIIAVISRETATVNGYCDFYVDGVLFGTRVTISSAAGSGQIGTGGFSVSNAGSLYVSGTNAVRDEGSTSFAATFNRALTAAEVLDLYRNGVSFADKWGSQTELMPNQVDRDFSGASAWANVDLNAYDETTDLTITATAANQYCTLPVASAPTAANKKYRMTFGVANIVSTWTIKSFDGTQTIGTVTANGAGQKLEWTASTTGGYRIVSASTTSSGDFDNFTLVAIGATLALEPEGIQPAPGQWLDSSSNKLNALMPAPGATRTLPTMKDAWYIKTTGTVDQFLSLADGGAAPGTTRAILPALNYWIDEIYAYSAGTPTFALGDTAAAPATLVASTVLVASTWTRLPLLKNSTTGDDVFCDFVSGGAATQFRIRYHLLDPA